MGTRSIPSPSPVQDLQTGCPWNVALQITQGRSALRRLRAFEGVPPPYQRVKKQVAPHAMRSICFAPGRKYCTVGRISHEVGWKYQDVVQTLENKRKLKASVAYGKKGVYKKTKRAAFRAVAPRIAAHQKVVHELGHK